MVLKDRELSRATLNIVACSIRKECTNFLRSNLSMNLKKFDMNAMSIVSWPAESPHCAILKVASTPNASHKVQSNMVTMAAAIVLKAHSQPAECTSIRIHFGR